MAGNKGLADNKTMAGYERMALLMKSNLSRTACTGSRIPANRSGHQPLRLRRWLVLPLLLLLLGGTGLAQELLTPQPASSSSRALTLEDIQLQGTTRTGLATVYEFLPLRPGQTIDQGSLLEGVAALRASGLFAEVDFFTQPGATRGRLILVLEVREHGLDLRWAAGNTNLDGWYLAPAALAYHNPFGKAGHADLQWRIGFRTSGLLLSYDRPLNRARSRYWGLRLSSVSTDRPWFADGVEYRHNVNVGGLSAVVGRRLGARNLLETGLTLEGLNVADEATAFTNSADGSVTIDQDVSGADLPADIRDAVGTLNRAVLHLDWQHDNRDQRRRAGTPTGGSWGRLKLHTVLQKAHSHPGLSGDLRLFREVPGGVLATRVRAAWVGPQARFYDRLFLGGMHRVRGFPTHALSAPGGDTWQVTGSLEYRSTIITGDRGARLVGLFFLDAGAGGSGDSDDPYPGVAAAVGYGVRARARWLGWYGVDVGFPLTDRPLDMRFQVNASIGWSF